MEDRLSNINHFLGYSTLEQLDSTSSAMFMGGARLAHGAYS